jgi:chromosome segregation ATPase
VKQQTEEIETAKGFESDITQLREKKRKLDETVEAAQKQLAEYTEINKTNVHAMEEIQRIEDSLVARKKELDTREEDIRRKEAGLEEMRAIAMKLFPKVTAAASVAAQKK